MQNPVLGVVHRESVKVYLHMCIGNVQQNPRCAASCVTKDRPISPRFSPTSTIFHRDANSVQQYTLQQCTVFDTIETKLVHPKVVIIASVVSF